MRKRLASYLSHGVLAGTVLQGATALALVMTPTLAGAQARMDALEEITVTATRREAGLQTIGVSVTALSADALRDMNVTRTDDLAMVTPGLSLIQAGGAPVAGLIAIRGVAQNDFAPHLESANILYIDDVYRPSNGGNLLNMFDVERVEVLKGPQGTLFGRNATGGLIHVITRDPTQELEGYVDLTIGEYDLVVGEAALNIPLADNAAFRLATQAKHNDGWMKNSVGPDQMKEDSLAFRGKLLVEPTEKLRILLQGDWNRLSPNPAGGAVAAGGFAGPDGLGRLRRNPSHTDAGYVDADGSPFTIETDYPGHMEREEFNLKADISYSFGALTLTSITSYSELDITYSEDNDSSPYDIAIFRQNTALDTFTQELRLNGDYDRFRFTTGAFYLRINGDHFQNYQINHLGNYNEVLAPFPVLLLPVGLNQYADYWLNTRSWSLFAQTEYDLAERVTLTTGLRYTRDRKRYHYENVCEDLLVTPACPAVPDPEILAGAGVYDDRHSEGGVSARVQLDYRMTDDWLLFASYNRGYKAFNYNAGFAGAAPVAGARFDGEKLNAFEIGSKLDFWDNRARFNVSAFYYDYKDYQAFDQRGVDFILSNTDATIYGADAELTVRPGAGVNILLGVSLLDTKVKDIPIAGELFDREAPQAPDVTFNFALSKDFVFENGVVRVGVDGNYTASYYSQLTNAEVTKAGDNWLLNARISYTPPSENWELALFARNLLDDERLIYAFDITFPGNGLAKRTYGPPRWMGAQLRVNF